jgi:flagellar basal-body rod protein FlgG
MMTLIGLMQAATANSLVHYNAMNSVVKNVANYGTYGYKAEHFETFLDVDNNLQGYRSTETGAGLPELTQDEYHIALRNPNAFLMVTKPDGTQAYTRDGRLRLNEDRFLVTEEGDLIGAGIRVPTEEGKLLISENGEVTFREKKNTHPQVLGHLDVVRFNNPDGLQRMAHNQLLPTERSGQPQLLEKPRVMQGALERSNVDLYDEIHTSMRINTGVITNLRLIKVMDELLNQAIRIRQ